MNSYRKLGELLVDKGLISNLQLSVALAAQQTSNRRLGEIVVARGFASEEQIASCLAQQYGYELVDPTHVSVTSEAKAALSADQALSHLVLPISLGTHFESVIADPIDIITTDLLTKLTGRPLNLKLAPASQLRQAIRTAYGLDEPEATATVDHSHGFPAPDRFCDVRARRAPDGIHLFDATDRDLDRNVTLAAVPSGSEEEAAQYRFIRAAARSCSPFVATVHDWFEWGGFRWTVFDRFEGENLAHILKTRGARSLSQSADVISQIATGVDAIHQTTGACGFIAPENVLISDNTAKLMPLARPQQVYSAPGDHPNSTATDIFALGTLLWESISGVVPHKNGWADAEQNDTLTPALKGILVNCLKTNPDARYPSALLLSSALKAYNWTPTVVAGGNTSPVSTTSSLDRDALLDAIVANTEEPKKQSFWKRLFGLKAQEAA